METTFSHTKEIIAAVNGHQPLSIIDSFTIDYEGKPKSNIYRIFISDGTKWTFIGINSETDENGKHCNTQVFILRDDTIISEGFKDDIGGLLTDCVWFATKTSSNYVNIEGKYVKLFFGEKDLEKITSKLESGISAQELANYITG
jgi:hypothetical protein